MKKTIYQPNNKSMLAKYLGVTPTTIHNWKRDKPKKYNLVMIGWVSLCKGIKC